MPDVMEQNNEHVPDMCYQRRYLSNRADITVPETPSLFLPHHP